MSWKCRDNRPHGHQMGRGQFWKQWGGERAAGTEICRCPTCCTKGRDASLVPPETPQRAAVLEGGNHDQRWNGWRGGQAGEYQRTTPLGAQSQEHPLLGSGSLTGMEHHLGGEPRWRVPSLQTPHLAPTAPSTEGSAEAPASSPRLCLHPWAL